MNHLKRLIEVDLPIKRISAHARREKSIRHGHISTLHIWWARRPLAACRAVICAALWPDPADPLCPESFRDVARNWMREWATDYIGLLGSESYARFVKIQKNSSLLEKDEILRQALLDFIADFANWDSSTKREYLETSRALTQAAHEALGGASGTKPLIVDSFAGGGAIPLEALRVGADTFASDLNPVAVLLNKVVLEYIPRYGQRLADEVRKWGEWVKHEAEKELAEFYPKDPDGAIPIAYLWARTVICEGPGCGVEIPLIKSLWLGKKPHNSWSLRLISNRQLRRVDFDVVQGASPREVEEGTTKRGSATCPCCGYTTPATSVRRQLSDKLGGTATARLFCVVTKRPDEQGRLYRLPTHTDLEAVSRATTEINRRRKEPGRECVIPDEPLPPQGTLGFRVQLYGINKWGDLFTPRQSLVLITLNEKVQAVRQHLEKLQDDGLAEAVQVALALNVDKMADYGSSLASWSSPASQETVRGTFSRQALAMVWDFAEAYPFVSSSGGWTHNLNFLISPLEAESASSLSQGHVEQSNATSHFLPDDYADAFITDPPYYDAIPYADLSDFFVVWLKRSLRGSVIARNFSLLTPKAEECVVDEIKGHDAAFFEQTMTKALEEGRRLTRPNGVGIVVFAHKSTQGWEAQLQAMINAGWVITGSWPIDTEREGRVRANSSAALTSSIHLVCRPRENPDGSVRIDEIGDWRDVLQELPKRIHEWMPRLCEEGIVGADAIFACLGPALEIFSRYSQVEKASGEQVTLREYLEQVWAAVAKEAFNRIFEGANVTGFEEDARLTAIWFWVLKSANGTGTTPAETDVIDIGAKPSDIEDEVSEPKGKKTTEGYIMEYDAVRKLAQGLGINLERLSQPGGIIVITGSSAILNSVAKREQYLFGRQLSFFDDMVTTKLIRQREKESAAKLKTVAQRQRHLYDLIPNLKSDSVQPHLPHLEIEDTRTVLQRVLDNGSTMLDRLHQAMLLFAHSYSALLRPFLLETQFASDVKFWQLAQSLSALYPTGSDEKRWIDGVLARKKALGL